MSSVFTQQPPYIQWSALEPKFIEADLSQALNQAEQALEELTSQDRGRMSFQSVVLNYEEALRPLNEAWGLVSHLDSVCNSEELRAAYNQMLPKISAFYAKTPLDPHLWDLFLTYSKTDDAKALTGVQKRCLEESLASFRAHGAELPDVKKLRLQEIEGELSQLTQKYSENVLDSTNAWEFLVEDESRLAGLPESARQAARADAKAKGLGTEEKPVYRFTLKAPSMLPVMEHVKDDELRKTVWLGSSNIGHTAQHDNTDLVWKILALRHEKAQLLGKANFADYILDRRMAKNGATALAFVEDLHRRVHAEFQREVIALQEYVADQQGAEVRLLEPWEVGYWSEQRRRERYDFDEEQLRPYFPVTGVLNGMFRLAERLFDLQISERNTVFYPLGETGPSSSSAQEDGPVEVWHPEVKFYEMRNEEGVLIGSFYADWHPRDSKRGGAWMNYLIGGTPATHEQDRRPHLGLICGNMTPPMDGKDALLTHDEVCTVFHEFGHLLHQLLGSVEIPSMNGVNVAWDFVELPSQLLENFCWERESLDFFARHFETGEVIPEDLFQKMLRARNYMGAVTMMRQLSFGKLDLELHMHYATAENVDLDQLSREILKDYLMTTQTQAPSMARRFGHLFSSPVGYAASYYSYKWAEVLDADAFTRFQQEGILEPAVGRAFRECILSKGNSDDSAKLFHDFMGREPDINALLVRSGLVGTLLP